MLAFAQSPWDAGGPKIYLSAVQRKILQPNDFVDLEILEQQLLACGRRYQQIARSFQWKFSRDDQLLDRVACGVVCGCDSDGSLPSRGAWG